VGSTGERHSIIEEHSKNLWNAICTNPSEFWEVFNNKIKIEELLDPANQQNYWGRINLDRDTALTSLSLNLNSQAMKEDLETLREAVDQRFKDSLNVQP
jgi:hypothetical protein